jgi:hypothetical protein
MILYNDSIQTEKWRNNLFLAFQKERATARYSKRNTVNRSIGWKAAHQTTSMCHQNGLVPPRRGHSLCLSGASSRSPSLAGAEPRVMPWWGQELQATARTKRRRRVLRRRAEFASFLNFVEISNNKLYTYARRETVQRTLPLRKTMEEITDPCSEKHG